MPLSSFLQRFDEPATLKMAQMGRDLAAKGIEVVNLSLGEPDFDTPQHIKDAAIKAINENYSHYTPVPGYVDARQAACVKLKRDNSLDYTPEQIVFSTGAKQSLLNAIFAVVDDGDEVVNPHAILGDLFRTRENGPWRSGFRAHLGQCRIQDHSCDSWRQPSPTKRRHLCFLPPVIHPEPYTADRSWKAWRKFSGNIPISIS